MIEQKPLTFNPAQITMTQDPQPPSDQNPDIPPELEYEQDLIDYSAAFQSVNDLTELGNAAIQAGLIAGHGYHSGKYEILCNGEALLFTPEEAEAYLKSLFEQAESDSPG